MKTLAEQRISLTESRRLRRNNSLERVLYKPASLQPTEKLNCDISGDVSGMIIAHLGPIFPNIDKSVSTKFSVQFEMLSNKFH